MTMTFEQFRTNVEAWATERGIYEHSTALAQALKAVSEVGELADAVIKNDRAALIDAIGDVAVCLVNVAYLSGRKEDVQFIFDNEPYRDGTDKNIIAGLLSFSIGGLCNAIVKGPNHEDIADMIGACFFSCHQVAVIFELDFLHCCETAWHEIKDRKGRMVAGGAFVKE